MVRTAILLVSLAAISVLSGCRAYISYPGCDLPRSQVAVLDLAGNASGIGLSTDYVQVAEIDGQKILDTGNFGECPGSIKLLPGHHKVVFMPTRNRSGWYPMEIDVKAGKSYKARAKYSDDVHRVPNSAWTPSNWTTYEGTWKVEVSED